MRSPWWRAVLRLFAGLLAVGMTASRLGLLAHELIGHGATALVLGGEITKVRLFWFAGGWINYRLEGEGLAAAIAVSLGGIVLEAIVGIGLYAGLARRPDTIAIRIVRGLGAALLLHACVYFAAGTWHGYGDGLTTYYLLGSSKEPIAIAVGLVAVLAAFAGARLVFGAFTAEVPGSVRAKVAGVLLAGAAATGLLAGVAIGEVVLRNDQRYGGMMQSESARETDRELAQWLEQRPRVSNAELEAERARIAARHSEPPFRVPLGIAIALAVIAGVYKARPAPPVRATARQLAIAGVLAVGSIGVVIAIDLAC